MSISNGSYIHFPRHLSCVTLLFSLSSRLQEWIHFVLWFRWRSVSSLLSSPRHKLWCLLLESRRCLVIYLFQFHGRVLQFFTRALWYSRHFFSVADVHVYVAFISKFVLLIVVVKFFVEFTEDIGNPFTRRDDFSAFILKHCNEHFLFCRFDSWDVADTFEVFEYFLDFLLLFQSFLVSDTFFDAFAQLFHSLFLFLGCTSPQLDESSDFRVLSWNFNSLFLLLLSRLLHRLHRLF